MAIDDNKNEMIRRADGDRKFWQLRKSAEEERMQRWNEKRATEGTPVQFEFAPSQDKPGITNLCISKIEKNHTSIDDEAELKASITCAAFGVADHDYCMKQLSQTLSAQFATDGDADTVANATIAALVSMKPNDVIEGQLCSRLLILTGQINEFMSRACTPGQPLEVRERHVNLASKLMRIYNESLDTLTRYRRKGESKVNVQHVTVNDGGRAVVSGDFTQECRGTEEKIEGVAHAKKDQ